MTATDVEGYRHLAHTLRNLARTHYRWARQSEQAGGLRMAEANRQHARNLARDARRWDTLARLGQA